MGPASDHVSTGTTNYNGHTIAHPSHPLGINCLRGCQGGQEGVKIANHHCKTPCQSMSTHMHWLKSCDVNEPLQSLLFMCLYLLRYKFLLLYNSPLTNSRHVNSLLRWSSGQYAHINSIFINFSYLGDEHVLYKPFHVARIDISMLPPGCKLMTKSNL